MKCRKSVLDLDKTAKYKMLQNNSPVLLLLFWNKRDQRSDVQVSQKDGEKSESSTKKNQRVRCLFKNWQLHILACEKVYAIFSVIFFFRFLKVHRENGDDNLRKQKLILAIQLWTKQNCWKHLCFIRSIFIRMQTV